MCDITSTNFYIKWVHTWILQTIAVTRIANTKVRPIRKPNFEAQKSSVRHISIRHHRLHYQPKYTTEAGTQPETYSKLGEEYWVPEIWFSGTPGISRKMGWWQVEPDLNLGRVKNTLIWAWRKNLNWQLPCCSQLYSPKLMQNESHETSDE